MKRQKVRYWGRLKGFTLLEVLIALVISSILFGMVLSVFSSLKNVYSDKFQKSSHNQEFLQVVTLLQTDFENSDYLILSEDSFCFLRNKGDTLRYIFLSDGFIRSIANISDTITLNIQPKEIVFVDNSQVLVSQLLLNAKINNLIYPIHIKKEYSRFDLYLYFLDQS
jgi:prepilin-type N-terminal cleavage/methylation domain-containing protein